MKLDELSVNKRKEIIDCIEELAKFNIEVNEENVDTVRRLMNTPQYPEGFKELFENASNSGKLKHLMRENEIKSIVHSEGVTVWDHTKISIEKARDITIPTVLKNDISN